VNARASRAHRGPAARIFARRVCGHNGATRGLAAALIARISASSFADVEFR
jgi:hypothetical protein